jgi:hypothetical protein
MPYTVSAGPAKATAVGFVIGAYSTTNPGFERTEYSLTGSPLRLNGVPFEIVWSFSGRPRLTLSMPLPTEQHPALTDRRFWTTGRTFSVGGNIAEVTLMCTPGCTPEIRTASLPAALAGRPYNASLTAIGGTPPYTWSAKGLPPEIAIVNGRLTGIAPVTPKTSYKVTIAVEDSLGRNVRSELALEVVP